MFFQCCRGLFEKWQELLSSRCLNHWYNIPKKSKCIKYRSKIYQHNFKCVLTKILLRISWRKFTYIGKLQIKITNIEYSSEKILIGVRKIEIALVVSEKNVFCKNTQSEKKSPITFFQDARNRRPTQKERSTEKWKRPSYFHKTIIF